MTSSISTGVVAFEARSGGASCLGRVRLEGADRFFYRSVLVAVAGRGGCEVRFPKCCCRRLLSASHVTRGEPLLEEPPLRRIARSRKRILKMPARPVAIAPAEL